MTLIIPSTLPTHVHYKIICLTKSDGLLVTFINQLMHSIDAA